MTEALKPCPECGRAPGRLVLTSYDPQTNISDRADIVICVHSRSAEGRTKDEATRRWNKRSPAPSSSPREER